MGTSHPSPGLAGAVGLVAWHPLTAGMRELGSEGLDCAAGSGFGVGASTQVNASQYLPGFPRFPHSHGGAEAGAGGTEFALVPHPHPHLPRDTAAGPVRMRPGGVTSGSGNSPCSGLGDKSRLLLHLFPLCSPAPRPAGLCALPRCWPLGTWLRRGVHPRGYAPQGGRGGRQECCHPRRGLLAAGRWDVQGMLEGCSGSCPGKPGILWMRWTHGGSISCIPWRQL